MHRRLFLAEVQSSLRSYRDCRRFEHMLKRIRIKLTRMWRERDPASCLYEAYRPARATPRNSPEADALADHPSRQFKIPFLVPSGTPGCFRRLLAVYGPVWNHAHLNELTVFHACSCAGIVRRELIVPALLKMCWCASNRIAPSLESPHTRQIV